MKKNSSLFFSKENKICGRVEDLVKNNSVKSGRTSMEDQSFDTQRHLAIDFAGNFKSISKMRSVGIASEFSLLSIEVDDCREMVRASLETSCRRVFMAETLPLNPSFSCRRTAVLFQLLFFLFL